MTAPYLATLNPEQRNAVEHSDDQPLLIIAGAGSGKTNTLAHRVAHLSAKRGGRVQRAAREKHCDQKGTIRPLGPHIGVPEMSGKRE